MIVSDFVGELVFQRLLAQPDIDIWRERWILFVRRLKDDVGLGNAHESSEAGHRYSKLSFRKGANFETMGRFPTDYTSCRTEMLKFGLLSDKESSPLRMR